MAIANGTCISFCNQGTLFGILATSRESRRYVVASASSWLRQENLRHILASPAWVRPWDNRDKFYMDGKRIQCLSNASQHVSIYLQPFPSILRHFSTFLHILASPGYAPRTIAVIVTWIEREFNACQTPRSMYPSIFNRFPVIEPESSNVHHFSTFFCIFSPPLGTPLGQSR